MKPKNLWVFSPKCPKFSIFFQKQRAAIIISDLVSVHSDKICCTVVNDNCSIMAATTEMKDSAMADSEIEEETPRTIQKIYIKIANAKSLNGSKGSNVLSFVKLEFGTSVIGESPKCENDSTRGITSFEYECSMNIAVNDPIMLDDLVQFPLVLSVIEVLPKDKKAKEERTNAIGQACVDMMPLLQGEKNVSATVTLHPPASGSEPVLSENQALPEIEVSLSVNEPLFTSEQLKVSNMMRIGVESLYSPPEPWNVATANQFMYFIALPIPISAQKEVTVLIPGGTLRLPGEKEAVNNKKWCSPPTASGACLYMPDRPIIKHPHDQDEGDMQSRNDMLFREEAESEKISVCWNVERRCFLTKAASENFMRKIAQHRIWPLEVFRTMVSQGAKAKSKGEDENMLSFHGIAYVDMAPLLYPGVKKIHGAFLIKPFNETDLLAKTGRKGTVTDDAAKLISFVRSSSSIVPAKAPAAKAGKLDGKPKASAAVLKPSEPAADSESHDLKKSEGQLYDDAQSYIVIDFQLDSSLVPKREPAVLAKKVLELIPQRPLFPKKEGGAKKAIEGFQNQIGITANMLLDDFQSMFSSQLSEETDDGAEKRKREFLYHLNSSGKYFAMKEQLKYFVIKIVREKFLNTTQFASNNELQTFISQLYDFLIAQMHGGLKSFLTKEETTEVPPPVRDSAVMKFFAEEAATLFDYSLAAKYYQERITLDKKDTEHWLDYGCFCLYIDDIEKATECFKEVVSIDQKHFAGLVMNGCIAVIKDDVKAAEIFFESAAYSHPTNKIAWTALGLYYAGVQNDILAERAFNEAKRLNDPSPSSKKSYIDMVIESSSNQVENINQSDTDLKDDDDNQIRSNDAFKEPEKHAERELKSKVPESVYLSTARFLLDHRALSLAERALSHELVSSGESAQYFQLLAEIYLYKKEFEKSRLCIDSCLKDQHQNPDAWTLLGHYFFLTGDKPEAMNAYERTLSYCSDANDIHSLYLRLASIYLELKEFLKAKDIYLNACTRKASCMTWLGAGIALYRLGEFSEAEQALNEANVLDNHNSMVWTYLALVCLQQKRHLEAEHCYKYAIKTGPLSDDLLSEIKQSMLETGFDVSLIS